MHRVCGRAQAPTAGLQHAPLALGDDDERVTRGLRIQGFFPRELQPQPFFRRELVAA